jgi:hypothetical protein
MISMILVTEDIVIRRKHQPIMEHLPELTQPSPKLFAPAIRLGPRFSNNPAALGGSRRCIGIQPDLRKSRTGIPALPLYQIRLIASQPPPAVYPRELQIIGDHLRKKRLE